MPAKTHGMRETTEYEIWCGMWKRCTNENHQAYARYGGRGITVCNRWKDFANFYADMGPRPAGETIERLNNDGDYEPGNCCWASRETQARNTSRSLRIEAGQKFGMLTAIKEAERLLKDRRQRWEFLCECGNSHVVRIDRVLRGRIKSCGCLKSIACAERNRKQKSPDSSK